MSGYKSKKYMDKMEQKKQEEEKEKREKEMNSRLEIFIKEYRELSAKHQIDIYARLKWEETGIFAVPAFKFLDINKGQEDLKQQEDAGKNSENK
jgi:hypothetical protein